LFDKNNMAFSADALFGIFIGLIFFALGVATLVQANRGKKVPSFGFSSSGDPISTTTVVKDYPNIVFGSLFLVLSVTLLTFTGKAISSA
jgi:hypothetical protein